MSTLLYKLLTVFFFCDCYFDCSLGTGGILILDLDVDTDTDGVGICFDLFKFVFVLEGKLCYNAGYVCSWGDFGVCCTDWDYGWGAFFVDGIDRFRLCLAGFIVLCY